MIHPSRIVLLLFLLGLTIFSCSPRPENPVILCAGDSITQSSYPHYLQKAFAAGGVRTKVHNFGRSGNTSGEYLHYLSRNRESMEKLHPDFILLQLGTNDVRVDHDRTSGDLFYRNMKNIITLFGSFTNRRGRPSRIFLALIPPVPKGLSFPFSSESRQRVLEEINPLITRIAEEENVVLVDNFSLFVQRPQLLKGVHPTQEGYKKLAHNWHKALMSHLE